MSDELRPGLTGTASIDVTAGVTADHVGSGTVAVLATPEVLALVERAAVAAVAGALPEGSTTVGSRVELDHLAPTAIGGRAEASVRLASVDGRTLDFEVEVVDAAGVVARGRHLRVVVDARRFMGSAAKRLGDG